ncbi:MULTISPECIES: glycosyl hydrolase family 65 protein [unclassified Streptomyces]|uniref:glycoside hydrolase family 65 protein n=1 Tax=unclassified Streptomyces TaxID=2593676 RepID=UPI0001C1B10A|nr:MULTISPECIES: glycosyl hydrolase family 65 protein [unclassified Streptomyces]AEN11034.1 glycoside hydrolase family 65 central catalytic [Streptomyces sp. SirexAA-E]MYR65936.1 glycoside hydrolase family 65 protein [Streptomyces sp. SID4939]MYR99056.1 glycoside hydrolase family 65 protein [Streptomyces sp. SID4940]MYT63699.1 glycoside hydrolase family 65 protein [Streptomyces sp. SID8357]MYT85949.1 glycoside hydrolase family 65 protein [Streptomyces sp. SID8360]
MGRPAWIWAYEGYDPEQERLREALCTLGNGYFATRGAAPETHAAETHYPGTYVAGCYNRLVSSVQGRDVENEDMVNLPNWLPLRYRLRPAKAPPGPWLHPDHPYLVEHRQWLDLRGGTLSRRSVYEDDLGRRLTVEQDRLVHMGDPHLAALHTVFTAEGWEGELEVVAAIDGDVRNRGVARYRELADRHLTGWETGTEHGSTVWLRCRTVESDIQVALAARTVAACGPGSDGGEHPAEPEQQPRAVQQNLLLPLGPGSPAVVDKTVALYTSRDPAIGSPLRAAVLAVGRAPAYPALLASHHRAWADLWQQARLEVPGEPGRILRLHLFHVLQTLSPHTAELDVGVPARGLHGEAYRGHVFWDELFVLPFLNLHLPEVSRGLLDYRHRRLPAACRAARAAGRAGAMFPWQSADEGREETQQVHLNPRSGRWLPDHSHLQHHVGSAVAYNVWQYCQATGDTDYLYGNGAETLLQVARFWADRAEWDESLGRYRIRGVVGPDEYHDGYPGAERPGLDDNTYTNVTAAWVLSRAGELCRDLPGSRCGQLFEQIGLDPGELSRWDDIAHRLYVPWHRGVVSQFAGYGELAELDWAGYRARYGDIRRLDRILEAEGDTVNRYQASKQADVLMLGYLFSPRELAALFRGLGHELDDATWHSTVDYYAARTSHGSTLSSLVHAWVLARVNRDDAWTYAEEALTGDVADVQGGTTEEGIHLGAMAGTLDLVQRGLTGLDTRDDALWLSPASLPQLSKFRVRLRFRRHWDVDLRLRAEQLRIAVPDSGRPGVRVRLDGHTYVVEPGTSRWLDLPQGA